ncbi:oxidoreductase family protein [Arabidopsis lyrata subsp. lyrata]|uniref:Oxidoreductase family protein n=1 Tax=Arabidopsis lyrata subsp. lyrata TaxID=81972 RepID=D7KZW5_ARALL|nr:oxidoreductase family protein [Arabidopsis lyrata subsp. lyrata]
MANPSPGIAILGAGIFVKTQYIPRLAEISDLVVLKAIWSRTEESAKGAVEIARKHFPEVKCKWGDDGLNEIIQDSSIVGVAVVVAAETMVEMSLKMLKAGKHVLQEKPAAASISEIETAMSSYRNISADSPCRPIWAVAENYRFEPAFVELKKLIAETGDMMNVQLIIEGSMNSSNPYFSSSWRRNLSGGFILDMGVHYIAGLRMLVGCEVASVSATTSHVDKTLPGPDNITSNFQLENGCSGVFVMVVSSRSPKACSKTWILWRVVGLKGTVQLERGVEGGRHGYMATIYGEGGTSRTIFYPFSGVTEELKAFFNDISETSKEQEPRLSYVEGARDVAVLEAMLESGAKNGAVVPVTKF